MKYEINAYRGDDLMSIFTGDTTDSKADIKKLLEKAVAAG